MDSGRAGVSQGACVDREVLEQRASGEVWRRDPSVFYPGRAQCNKEKGYSIKEGRSDMLNGE